VFYAKIDVDIEEKYVELFEVDENSGPTVL
jgi:hypothetical protein